jgi:hypothetical protein
MLIANTGMQCRQSVPLHNEIDAIKQQSKHMLASTTIGDLLREYKEDFIKSIATTR